MPSHVSIRDAGTFIARCGPVPVAVRRRAKGMAGPGTTRAGRRGWECSSWARSQVSRLLAGSRLLAAHSSAGHVHQPLEGRGIVDGHLGEHLAVDGDLRLVEAGHEGAVGEAIGPRGGVDTHDPEAAHVALAGL